MGDTLSITIFRLGEYRLALPTNAIEEANPVVPIHKIPHISNSVLLGVANIRGKLQMVIALNRLLGIATKPLSSQLAYPRMLVFKAKSDILVFKVDEVCNIVAIKEKAIILNNDLFPRVLSRFMEGYCAVDDQPIAFLKPSMIDETLYKDYL